MITSNRMLPALWQSFLDFPTMSRMMLAFGLLYGVGRWWKFAAPQRKARISLFRTGMFIVLAIIFSVIFRLDTSSMVMLAGVTCLATQLAVPHRKLDSLTKLTKGL